MASLATTFPRSRVKTKRPRSQPVSGRTSLPVFYTVKCIDNSRLRREVNPEQRRECFALLGLGVLIFGFVFLFAWQHFQCVRYGYQIEQLKLQQATLEEWNHKLRIEQASLADPQRIDILARQSGLASPSPQQVIRVGPSGSAPISNPEMARIIPNLGPATAAITSGQ